MRVRFHHIFVVVIALIGVMALAAPVTVAQNDIFTGETCPALINLALAQVSSNCANLGGNFACWGSGEVAATLSETGQGTDSSTATLFSSPADRVTLNALSGLRTSPLNLDNNSWGVALLNVRAATTGMTVNDDVVMVLLGDVQVENAVLPENILLQPETMPTASTVMEALLRNAPSASAAQVVSIASGTSVELAGISPDENWLRVNAGTSSGWLSRTTFDANADFTLLPEIKTSSRYPMQSFNFRTGTALPACLGVPPSMLVLQAPGGVPATIEANGATITFTNTIFMRTTENNMMEVIGVTGDVRLNPDTSSEILIRAGVSVSAPLDGRGRISGEWANWRVLNLAEIDAYAAIEALPENVLNAPVALPAVLRASPSTDVPPVVINTPTPPFVPTPPPCCPFPRPPLTVGVPGQDLPGDFEPFRIGGPVCPAWIAYHSDRTRDWEIFRLGPTGGNDVSDNLSQGIAAADIQPSRSADAEWIAFTSNRDGLTNWEIYAGRTDGSERRRLTFNTGVDINPAWGPGNRIVFESNRDANWELYMLDVSTRELRRLTNDPNSDVDPVWTADGNSIIFASDRDGDYELYILDVDDPDLEVTQLTDNNTRDAAPVYSNETDQLAWLQLNEFGVYKLMIMDMATGVQEELLDLGTDINLASFSPSDLFIAFDSNVDGDFDVFAIELESREVKNVTNNTFNDRAPAFRCNSDIIVYQSDSPGQWDIFQINPMPIDANGPFQAPTRLTLAETTELYAMNQPVDEDGSREGRLP